MDEFEIIVRVSVDDGAYWPQGLDAPWPDTVGNLIAVIEECFSRLHGVDLNLVGAHPMRADGQPRSRGTIDNPTNTPQGGN